MDPWGRVRTAPGWDVLSGLTLYTLLSVYGRSGSVSVTCPVTHVMKTEVKSVAAHRHATLRVWATEGGA